ncbi:MAG: hypothetical protein LLF89_08040 [Spirochaetaceae bacterium]|nr:hypothetical protein [Spirochaetaceae bacterium]
MKSRRCSVTLLFLVLATASQQAVAADTRSAYAELFRNLSDSEIAALDRGEMIVHSLKDSGKLSLMRDDSNTREIARRVQELHPNYMTELMASVPMKSAPEAKDTLDRIAAALADVKGYINIPYWSKRQKTTYALFDKMDVLGRKPLGPGKGESIEVRQHMEPFDDFRMRYDYRVETDALRFSAVNLDNVIYTYQHFQAVSPDNMVWELYVFYQRDRLYVYGIGAVKAFDMFGLFRDRLEPSLMGRVEAFFTHIAKKTMQE